MYRPTPPAEAEQTQDNHHTFPFLPWRDLGGNPRSFPAELPFREYAPSARRWRQGSHVLRNFRPKYYYTRPCDGKRAGTVGRLKDALTGEGPDVFVTISGDKRTLMRDRPQRWQWSGWGSPWDEQNLAARAWDKDWREQDAMPLLGRHSNGDRHGGKAYNFRDRRFHSPRAWWWGSPNSEALWRNAQWAEGARRSDRSPLSKEYFSGLQVIKVPFWSGWGPYQAGGRQRSPWP
ncbi:hypothetical protein B0A55_09597 [Friedmanniomyces simplex]|uniref:Uncharacterized protein n=1 Tax=Friedmanniomyces simplex TaxID=329884 RepID=A0A4U0WU04_9PEZI|nr:hypothetical protein B0A55_09597 [Friedmanniomyces simplex]